MARKVIKPPGQDAAASGGQTIAPPDLLRIAAFGDSLMWGQGLRSEEKFKNLIAGELRKLHKKKVSIVADRSRSGAQIMARTSKDGKDPREIFLDRFPNLFTNRPQRERFRSGTDEGRANDLFGEIPASFPTVRWQVQSISTELGKTIDVVLLCGGANDIGFDTVIDPTEFPGEFIREFDGLIRTIAHDDVFDLIRRVRSKCPNAVILFFGYFAPISHASHVSKIRAFFKHELDDDFGFFLNKIFGFVDVEEIIREARVRSVWAQGRAQHWMRTAVSDANQDAVLRGPGILFIPSGIDAGNAAFANNPQIFGDFEDPANDPVRNERVRRCPRAEHLNEMRAVANRFHGTLNSFPAPSEVRSLSKALADQGPESLAAHLARYASGDVSDARELRDKLGSEIHRIERARIASFLHPNSAGARQYADIALRRYRHYLELMAEIPKNVKPEGPAAGVPVPGTLDGKLRRYGLRSSGPLAADIGHLDVDAISVRVVTASVSQEKLTPDIFLVVETQDQDGKKGKREYRLNFPYHFPVDAVGRRRVRKLAAHFEPAETNRFTIDTVARLRLDEITSVHLRMDKDPLEGELAEPHGTIWRPRRVEVEFNGRRVLDRTFQDPEIRSGDTLNLAYPPPPADTVAPT